MKSRFQPDIDLGVAEHLPTTLADPEAYDASEQQFAASLEDKARPRFVVDETSEAQHPGSTSETTDPGKTVDATTQSADDAAHSPSAGTSAQSDLLSVEDSGSWREEVAARVSHYRARRRTRAPRYPSLQLRFETPESWEKHDAPKQASVTPAANRMAVAMQDTFSASALETPEVHPPAEAAPMRLDTPADSPKVLEFPRSGGTPPLILDELAEPVFDHPRILEAPELLPPPPALGGILIEPGEEPAKERRPGFELPLQSAPMSRRLLATAADGVLVLSAFAAFAYIFLRFTSAVPPLRQAVESSLILTGIFWSGYQYLLLVYAGTTPGLKLAKLRLSRFDGTGVPKRVRRWRVLASLLSGLSLALGYAWCFLDEDQLCWHDRITRTYIAPKSAD